MPDRLRRHLRPAFAALALLLMLPAVAQEPAPVRVTTPEPARFGERFSLTGSLTAERDADLSPRVDGLVAALRVDAGERVEAGQILLELDATLAGHALARARAASAEAAARVAEAQRLLDEAARAGNALPATQLATREAELRLAEANLAAVREAEREQAELLARHRLPAPFAGVIAERRVDEGEWVTRGTPVLRLVAPAPVRLDLRAPQERYAELTDAVEVRVFPDAAPGEPLQARIEARVPVTDAGARTFLLRLRVEDPAGRLLPGMSARAEFALPASEPALAVPRDALLRQPDGGYSLFVVEGEGATGVARQRSVRVLRDQGAMVAVGEGIAAGERVVVRGNEALRDGQAVRVEGP